MKTAAHISLSGDRPNRWGYLSGNIQDQVDLVQLLSSKASNDDIDELNQALDNILDSLENLSDEIGSKASAASVIQALSTKADLVNGVVPASQLPAFVDDVLNGKLICDVIFEDENENIYSPESGKIYIDVDTNKSYRWSGIKYVVISDSLALGETASTAGRGDYVKAAHDHALSQGNPHNVTTSEITETNNVRFFKENLVRATVLTGIVFTNKNKATAADSIETAIGKIQGQLDDFSVPIWVNVTTLGVVFSSYVNQSESKIELQKRNGNIYMRGYIRLAQQASGSGIEYLRYTSQDYALDTSYAINIGYTMAIFNICSGSTLNNATTISSDNIGTHLIKSSGIVVASGTVWHIPEVCIGKAKT
ncbi:MULTISPECIES: hypothetical protein [unclassified Acinetobacter]|uniref:hypothetical protein n=1 Tax=unclassified Acinetobacter TaxID=196816 RepID=UPI00244C0CBE|nr:MULTISPECIES: hypothetical protein [unclassified Acinetobacter]MDH0032584.1 hypothetical protein [Acinetobacter sp. GD04021]MDH0885275.1 hypothetical protein [Acinetobacter sp. GD03873]MDH1084397.1 hypothetical protein [Acinetobacter sp. GD03983]MDH2188285.1 hypothetical protein [Acinetobacter sp. GD03645]MDH2203796.1 hypothetical protein [Acinetobacter sp. GD03647]